MMQFFGQECPSLTGDLEVAVKVDAAGRVVTDGDGQPEGRRIRAASTVHSAVTVYCLRCFLLDTGPRS